MKKKAAALLLMLLMITVSIPSTLFAASSEVKVTLPSFNVHFNGVKIENAYRQYPLIVYKDITYFPMTYYDSRFLGVEAIWDQKKGLEIEKTGVSAAHRSYQGTAKNKNTQTAAIRTGDLKLNGKVIRYADAGLYPFLTFRNVTYFPLTWNYAVKELGWSYQFDSKSGLSIVSANPQVKKAAAFPGTTEDGAVIYEGYSYSIENDGVVVRSPVGNAGKSEEIYQLPLWSEGPGHVIHGDLYVEDGDLWLFYHQGGAVMGSDFYLRLNEQGEFEEVESGYLTFRTFGNTKVKVNLGVPPSTNNLSVQIGDQEEMLVGDPAYLYGWNWRIYANGTAGGEGSGGLYLINNDLYLLAFNMEKDTDFSRIHKVNLETNETTRISELKVTSFTIAGKTLYLNSEGVLYRVPLEGGAEERLNSGSKVVRITEDEGYILCTFAKEATTPYTLIVYDQSGKVVFKTSDIVSSATVEKGMLYYVEETSKNVYAASLK